MARLSLYSLLALSACDFAITQEPGLANVGTGQAKQFITGPCVQDVDCASGCCVLNINTRKEACSSPNVATGGGKQGCSSARGGRGTPGVPFGGGQAGGGQKLVRRAGEGGGGIQAPDPAGAKNVGKGDGSQFIPGECKRNADCESNCCALVGGKDFAVCSGPDVGNAQGKQGCGSAPGEKGGNNNGNNNNNNNNQTGNVNGSSSSQATNNVNQAASGLKPDPAGAKNVGNGKGLQFIGAECGKDRDCASGCCAGVTGQPFGLCSGVGAQTQNGKKGCGTGPKQGGGGGGQGRQQ
ncbi:hypothetical protein L249_1957 [Ophiocordyceps polyrhachis-furcata BCC 54312]|uniref:Biotrophy-associated secreted protein 2 n=1 Tax=Ophiocordyceps polyrhachis-furcata BCC 54312 TaxID=1330021 RepID=A0A367LNC7_9HYPO|nr:hypothetical protein L249_1957 [Ophiocordyceps polyrhachis-furcata BCC 54312]